MKKYFAILPVIFFFTSISAQEMKIALKALPAPVLEAFRAAYPNARISNTTKGMQKGVAFYEISCKDDDAKRTITFDSKGKIIETEEELTVDRLPDKVAKAILERYPKRRVLHIEKSDKNSKTLYEVQFREKKKLIEAVFTPEGKLDIVR
jgi:hypothetical protein